MMKNIKLKILHFFWFWLCALLIIFVENLFLINDLIPKGLKCLIIILFLGAFVFMNVHPDPVNKIKNKKLHHCAGGLFLLENFLFTLAVTLFIFLAAPKYFNYESGEGGFYIFECFRFYGFWHVLGIFLIELVIFWNGIIRIYLYSTQIGIKYRVIGAICGMITPVNLVVLLIMVRIVSYEINIESAKEELNEKRKDDQICKTKYPILMVHGVFFRDFKHFNYWGRVPAELEKNGAVIFYGKNESANSVEKTAEFLATRVKEILKETGAEKVNIIAHSKGGLDSRYMISNFGMEDYVASLTTINTPHRGCKFAEFLLDEEFTEGQKKVVSSAYNKALKFFGDDNPDFISAVTDLTASSCNALNEKAKDSSKVFYQSYGSIMKNLFSGKFPLNCSYLLVKKFDGPNDGLVGEKSFEWGSKFTLLKSKSLRGISHGDMIDLNRQNIRGFDVREFYVQLVSELRKKGF